MHIGFNWDTNDMSIVLFVKFGKTLGTARIVINSVHVKGDVWSFSSYLVCYISTENVCVGFIYIFYLYCNGPDV